MSTKRLGDVSFVSILPEAIRDDAQFNAAATSLDSLLHRTTRAIPNLLVWARLDRERAVCVPPLQGLVDAAGGLKPLSTEMLELLAWQFHVDFRATATTHAQLAAMILDSIPWHRIKGTPASIKQALGLFGYTANIEEDGVGEYWATYQLGLPQIADIPTVRHIVKICNEMAPARCRLWRIYTDVLDQRPVIWSGGSRHDRWSEGWWTMYSGVPVPDPDGNGDLIVSFGTRNGFQAEVYCPGRMCGSFGATTQYGFLAPYLDRPIWIRSAWSDVYPRNHGFVIGSLFSILWADRATTGRRWRGFWDARSWLDYTGFDRKLPPWRMGRLAWSHSQSTHSGGSLLSDINACYSRPTAVTLDAPPVWGAVQWSQDGNALHRLFIDERFITGQVVNTAPLDPGVPRVAGAAWLSVTDRIPDPVRAQAARHDEAALTMFPRKAPAPVYAVLTLSPLLSQHVAPDASPPLGVCSLRAPLWLGAWTEPCRIWRTEKFLSNQ